MLQLLVQADVFSLTPPSSLFSATSHEGRPGPPGRAGQALVEARSGSAPCSVFRPRGGPPYQSRQTIVASSRRSPPVACRTAAPRACTTSRGCRSAVSASAAAGLLRDFRTLIYEIVRLRAGYSGTRRGPLAGSDSRVPSAAGADCSGTQCTE